MSFARFSTFPSVWACRILICALPALAPALGIGAAAQTPAPAAQNTASASQPPAQASAGAPQLPHVNTTVVVRGEVNSDYLPESIAVGSIESEPLVEAPLSATVVKRDLLSNQVARLLTDVVKDDAAIGDDYAPVGYYSDFEIRGFPIDLATGLEINGLTIAGEQDVPLENKDRVEFLKGLAGIESGVASAGGLIDYVTKRPAPIMAFDLATDQRGTAYGAADLGHLFGSRKQVGARLNLAAERIVPYMNGTSGWRAVGAGAADWKIDRRATLKTDFEYQHKTEADGSGYQLLGGATLPDLNRIYASTMLGQQSWAPPDTYDVYNTGVRLDYDLNSSWHAFAAAGLSHSLIQDNVIYAYGCGYEAACQPGGAPAYFFAPDGGYDIYDYRDPGELRIDAQAEAVVAGSFNTGPLTHNVAAGAELFRRSVQQPGAPPLNAPATVEDGAVYTYIGSENIYDPLQPFSIEDPVETAGPRALWEDSHQPSAILQDRVQIPGRIQLIAGGRYDSLRDRNYSLTATSPSTPPTNTLQSLWLPQYAATFNPAEKLTLYANYGVLLSLGPEAPWWVDDANQFLAPFFTRQTEIGAKYEPHESILLTTALFHMRAPFFYPRILAGPDDFCPSGAAGDQCFEQQGRETHDGLELNAEGKAAKWLRLTGSAAAIRAISSGTGTPSYDNEQVLNVPHLRTTLFADVAIPHARGLFLMPGWSYTGRKEATRDDAVSVAGYNLFNLGLRYTPGGEQQHLTFRLYADNITRKRYWSDTGGSLGDTFLWLGAPPTVRLSAHYTF
jgi:iron complex outermembrane receptor protein